MKLSELIARLNEYAEDLGGDAEVRLMTQQNWPFENKLLGLCSGAEINDAEYCESDEDDSTDDGDVSDESVLYLVEGGQICYGSKRAWEICDK